MSNTRNEQRRPQGIAFSTLTLDRIISGARTSYFRVGELLFFRFFQTFFFSFDTFVIIFS